MSRRLGKVCIVGVFVCNLAASVSAQHVEGRFVAEKDAYLVGEPVFVVLEVKNVGREPIQVSDDDCGVISTRFEVDGASPLPERNLWGCGGGGYAGSCLINRVRLEPGKVHTRRYLLQGAFHFDRAGTYRVRATRRVQVWADADEMIELWKEQLTSEFDIELREGSQAELMQAFVPLLQDLRSDEWKIKGLALKAILHHPPTSLEETILALAAEGGTARAAIGGLKRLRTPAALKRLAELTQVEDEGVRQDAVAALGQVGDEQFCSLMLKLAERPEAYSHHVAMRAAGQLCGEKSLPLLAKLLYASSAHTRFHAAGGLGLTGSGEAVPLLIERLDDPDQSVRRAAVEALAVLTRRRSTSGIVESSDASQAKQQWLRWWFAQGSRHPIYDNRECLPAEPLR